MMIALLLTAIVAQTAGDLPCPRQPLPPPHQALAPVPGSQAIIFSANPSGAIPGKAWVVRLSRERYIDDASVEIVRLKRQHSCNRWDIEERWRASMPQSDFEALGRQLVLHTIPGAGTPAAGDPFRATPEAALHGTSVVLKLTTRWWEVSRNLHARGRSGTPVSELFYELVSKHVPEAERPERDWGSKSR